ncbi:MAG: ribbon-helix-helix protein, CopG family [Solirubrobacteraceae bacterium]
MISFRLAEDEAAEAQHWARTLGVDRSELLREALHRYLVDLRGEHDAAKWLDAPSSGSEWSLSAIADWGPAEDWAEWDDAAR